MRGTERYKEIALVVTSRYIDRIRVCNYIRFRNAEIIPDNVMLFLAKNGASLNVSSVKHLIIKYVKI